MSLATEPSFRFRPSTLVPQRVLEPPLKTTTELEQLREDLRKMRLYTGTLVSLDGHSTAILIGVPAGVDRTRLYGQVNSIVARKRQFHGSQEIDVTGAPAAESLLGIHILEDLGVPATWLGISTRSDRESEWKAPGSIRELQLLVTRRIGLVPIAALLHSSAGQLGAGPSHPDVVAVDIALLSAGLILLATAAALRHHQRTEHHA